MSSFLKETPPGGSPKASVFCSKFVPDTDLLAADIYEVGCSDLLAADVYGVGCSDLLAADVYGVGYAESRQVAALSYRLEKRLEFQRVLRQHLIFEFQVRDDLQQIKPWF